MDRDPFDHLPTDAVVRQPTMCDTCGKVVWLTEDELLDKPILCDGCST